MTGPDEKVRGSEVLGRGFAAAEVLATRLYSLRGWRRAGVAFALGLFSVAAQPPVSVLAVLVVTLPCLVWLLDGTGEPSRKNWRSARAAASIGWWFGFGYFLAGLYWIGEAFLVEAETFGWLLPFAVT